MVYLQIREGGFSDRREADRYFVFARCGETELIRHVRTKGENAQAGSAKKTRMRGKKFDKVRGPFH